MHNLNFPLSSTQKEQMHYGFSLERFVFIMFVLLVFTWGTFVGL